MKNKGLLTSRMASTGSKVDLDEGGLLLVGGWPLLAWMEQHVSRGGGAVCAASTGLALRSTSSRFPGLVTRRPACGTAVERTSMGSPRGVAMETVVSVSGGN
jgi:hypothetical protein